MEDLINIYCIKAQPAKTVYKDYTKKEFDERFEHALNSLNNEYKTLIQKVYIEKDSIWWVDYYSKSSYYRIRAKALNSLYAILNLIL